MPDEITSAEIANYPNLDADGQKTFRDKLGTMLEAAQAVISAEDFAEIMSRTGFVPNP